MRLVLGTGVDESSCRLPVASQRRNENSSDAAGAPAVEPNRAR
jgi:hypothetical protein